MACSNENKALKHFLFVVIIVVVVNQGPVWLEHVPFLSGEQGQASTVVMI